MPNPLNTSDTPDLTDKTIKKIHLKNMATRGKPKPRKGKGLLAWRSRQKPGAIMRPSTFERIKGAAKREYGLGEERAKKVAGKAYWTTVKAKFRKKKSWRLSDTGITKA